MKVSEMPVDPKNPNKHVNPETGIWPICEWGFECQRGFVRAERFSRGADHVIAGTNRATTRKWRKLNSEKQESF